MTRPAEPFHARPLKMDADPFASTAASQSGRQVQTAFREIVRHIVLQTPVILVTGPASAGKTLLVDMTARLCTNMGLSVRRVDRGDLLHIALAQNSDVLLVDEANSVEDALLESFAAEKRNDSATTTVFLGLPSCIGRFIATVDPVLIQFDLLSRSDAEHYLLERAAAAGFTNLFSDDSLDLIVDASSGSPRLLARIGSLAFCNAASDCAGQIRHKHAASAVAMQLPPTIATEEAKQAPPAEEAVVLKAKIDEKLHVSEKASPQIEGLFARADAGSPEGTGTLGAANTYGLGNDLWTGRTDENSAADLNRHSAARTLIRRGTLAACVVILVAAAAIAVVRPWAGLGPSPSNVTALPESAPAAAAVEVPAAPELPLSPAVPTEAASNSSPELAPAADPSPRTTTADSTKGENVREPGERRAVVPRPLSPEEQAAVARGIRELERAQTQAFQGRRR